MSKFTSQLSLYDNQGRRKYLNQFERSAFRKHLSDYDSETQMFCLLIFWTGMRLSEAQNIKVENFDFDENKVVVQSLKKREEIKFRQIPLPQVFLQKLKSFVRDNHLTESLWKKSNRSHSRYIKGIMEQAKIIGPQGSAKGLRHSYAVHCISRNIPLPLIQRWMGHESITTTIIYTQLVGIEERAFAQRIWEDP